MVAPERNHSATKNLRKIIVQHCNIPGTASVLSFTLNEHNKSLSILYETFQWENKDDDNPYRTLDRSTNFSLMHETVSVRPGQQKISANLKPAQSSLLMSLYVLQLLSDLHKALVEKKCIASPTENIGNFKTTKDDTFLASNSRM